MMRTRSSRLARTPVRNMWWSSTRTTSIASLMCSAFLIVVAHRRGEPHLGAVPRVRDELRRAAAPAHATEDRLAHPEPVVRDGVEVETLPAVAHEDLDAVLGDLEVDRDGRLAVPRRVEQRLTRREQERGRVLVRGTVADDDGLHGDRLKVLDLCDDRREVSRERGTRRQPVVVEPRAQLALLGPGD